MWRPAGLNRWTSFVYYLRNVSSLTQSLLFADEVSFVPIKMLNTSFL